jgi:hypothetical protein
VGTHDPGRLGRPRIFRAGAALCCFIFAFLASPGPVQRAQSHIRIGMPHDWTHHHVIFSNPTTPELARAASMDARYWHQRLRMQSETTRRETESSRDADRNEDGAGNRDIDGAADRDRSHHRTRQVDWLCRRAQKKGGCPARSASPDCFANPKSISFVPIRLS